MVRIYDYPFREYVLIILLSLAIVLDMLFFGSGLVKIILLILAVSGSVTTLWSASKSVFRRKINIDTFNSFAFIVAFATNEMRSAVFIGLMLAFARLLDWHTESRTKNATEKLLSLKPLKAVVETDDGLEKEVHIDEIKQGDILIIKEGASVPVDGVVVFGKAYTNESSVSGESELVEKVMGDTVISSTIIESGTIKIKATRVGKESTIEQMASLVREAALHKSHAEKMADKFAEFFLPFVLLLGAGTYFFTHNILMTASIFLVACADDMAVAIPLAMTASVGRAAKRGVIIKGGEWLETIGKLKILVLDKTGTLTYGTPLLSSADIEPVVDEHKFWLLVGIAEKFSEHSIGNALMREVLKRTKEIPDPDEFKVYKGSGVWAKYKENEILIGNESLMRETSTELSKKIIDELEKRREQFGSTTFLIFINKKFAGIITMSDILRKEAKESLLKIKNMGVEKIIMFTGDDANTARRIAEATGIKDVRASMNPETKLRELEILAKEGYVGMVGDGINDAPALSRADIGIAMGGAGTAVAVEAADVVILTDNLARLPELIALGRRTMSVIHGDIVIWALSNLVGFALVLTGIAGPVLAAFYNFATDFFPLINSARLFKK